VARAQCEALGRVWTRYRGYYTCKGQRLHRAVWEAGHGPIPEGWHVHHRDGDRENNAPANLEALSPAAHAEIHANAPLAYVASVVCAGCGAAFTTSSRTAKYCSRACGVAHRSGWPKSPIRTFTCQGCGKTWEGRTTVREYCLPVCAGRAAVAASRLSG